MVAVAASPRGSRRGGALNVAAVAAAAAAVQSARASFF